VSAKKTKQKSEKRKSEKSTSESKEILTPMPQDLLIELFKRTDTKIGQLTGVMAELAADIRGVMVELVNTVKLVDEGRKESSKGLDRLGNEIREMRIDNKKYVEKNDEKHEEYVKNNDERVRAVEAIQLLDARAKKEKNDKKRLFNLSKRQVITTVISGIILASLLLFFGLR